MFLELFSSAVVASIVGYSTLHVRGSTDDSKKIGRICYNAGLRDKETDKPIRLIRKSKKEYGMEYAYVLPLGYSFADFQKKREAIEDGLNQRAFIDAKTFLRELVKLKFHPNSIADIKKLLNERQGGAKTVELSYNGLLIVRVFNVAMPDYFEFKQEHFDLLKGWEILIGATKTKLIKHDFDKNVHLIVAGTTGGGKSVFLKSCIATLVARQTKHANLYLIDLKGGVALNRFSRLEQVKGFARNPKEALFVLKEAQVRMNAQLDYLLAKGYEDMKEAGFKDRYFIVIDEAADIGQHEEAQAIVEDIARRGRAAGFTLIYCTQYPTNETLKSQVRQNVSAQVVFRLKTEVASRAVIDEAGAEKIPVIPGRAIYRADEKIHVQTPFMSNSFIDETIKPHITFRSRKEDVKHEAIYREGEKGREYPLYIEEVRVC